MEAHIAALLPTQNRVVAADENTAFLAHYDLNEHDVLRNVKAIGETKSLKLAGTSASYVEAQHIPAYNVSALTIEAWIKVPSSLTATYRLIVGKSVGGRDFNFYVYSSGTTQITNLHMSSVFGGGLPALPTPFELNTWHHIAITVSPTGYITYYADGVAFGGTQGTATTASRTSPIKIGLDDNYWHGNVSNVRLWNRALSGTEINTSMNGSLPSEAGLVGYWKFNEGQGSVAYDLSAFHNDGIIYSGTWDIGNSVFTLREREGYFGGGAIAVEESTTNIVPNPTINSYPTIGNGWGTYQTNQYNNNVFFSIGTITSVINNEVTVVWANGIKFRTYDVLRPQTTGGGLTANTHYFIKMTSATTFTIHQYDGTQDGSKGFSVHDSIKNDVRIPINATSFPTMWHGAAHMPNSGLVKEVIRNGFSNNGVVHDCLRMYTNYTDQTESWMDYMAYGVNPTINANTQYTVSFYYRAVTPETIGRTSSFSMHNGVGFGSGSFTLQRDWQRYEAVVTSTATGGASLYWNAGKGIVWDIAEIQVEQKAFATSFTTGQRAGANLTYLIPMVSNPFTLNFWAKVNGYSGNYPFYINMYPNGVIDGNNRIYIRPSDYTTISGGRVVGGTVNSIPNGTVADVRGWHMYTLTSNGTTMKIYQDGTLITSSTSITDFSSSTSTLLELSSNTLYSVLYDELRIDKIERTDTEIAAWYYSNSPFWPRGIYRKPY